MDIPISIEEDSPERVYQAGDNKNTSLHEGQRKLLMTEIQFLTNMYDPDVHPDPVVLYVGSSPGYHINLLIQLFPQFEYYLVDPAPNKVNELAHYSNQFFTPSLAQYYKGLFEDRDVFFISDIRSSYPTGINRVTKDEELKIHNSNELLIHREMEMQREWVEILDPVACHLKFRLPWYTYTLTEEKARAIGVKGEYLQQQQMWEYLDGTIYIQPWATQFGTETRLVATRPYRLKDYDCIKYDRQLFHINMSRQEDSYDNSYYDPSPEPELIDDYDSCLEALIWERYVQKYSELEPEVAVTQLARLASDFLYMQYTGKGTSVRSLWSMRQSGMYDTAAMGRYPRDVLERLYFFAGQQRYRLFTLPIHELIPDNVLIDTYAYPGNKPETKSIRVTKTIKREYEEYEEPSSTPITKSSPSPSPITKTSRSSSSSPITKTSRSSSSSPITKTSRSPSSSSSPITKSSYRTKSSLASEDSVPITKTNVNMRSDGGVISIKSYSRNPNEIPVSGSRSRSRPSMVIPDEDDVPVSFQTRKSNDPGVISTKPLIIPSIISKSSRSSTEDTRRSFDSPIPEGVVSTKTIRASSESRRKGVEKSGRQ